MIDLIDISLQYTGKYLFSNVNFKINSDDRISLVGANGTGKSSLLNIIYGRLEPESGKLQKQKNISIGYLPQEQIVHSGKTLFDEASSALEDILTLQSKASELSEILANKRLSTEERDDLLNQLGEVQHQLEALDSYTAASRVEKILEGLGFRQQDFERDTNEFSGGWQMRIALSKILIAQNDILLLDEPTNHLDLNSLAWLINFLQDYKGALIIVSHDRHFINKTTNKTLEIFNSRVNLFNGNFDAYLSFKEERDEQLVHKNLLQQKKIKETQKFIERFRYKATKAKQIQSRIKQLDKIGLVELPDTENKIEIRFPEPPSSGVFNVELKSLTKAYNSNLVLDKIDLRVNRGDKIAFVGNNGAGKTTLAKIIAGSIDYDSGNRTIGYNTTISYYAQDTAESLTPDIDVLETLDGIAKDKSIGHLRSLLGAFLFRGDEVFKKVQVLSGGEKSRLALAKILLTKSNFIILDEPTNHLDYSSKAVLQKALIQFPGSLILVSHDVDFLKPLANRVVEVKNNSIKVFEGGIDYYLRKREEYLYNLEETADNKETSSRKIIKRLEAEERQKRFNATKDLIKQIDEVENEIEELEKDYRDIERELTNSDIYKNAEKVKRINKIYTELKKDIEEKTKLWEELTEKLHEIEIQFN